MVARAMHFLVERILADEPWHPEKYLSDATWAIPRGTSLEEVKANARFSLIQGILMEIEATAKAKILLK